ncbi:transposase [Catenuloplanes nepalensis]|uniref:Transposase n=1 Tax=Catenuloplanes nepalensis TaxID=587533 RepID=A0ABT9MUM7_9ACTN|nr:transposase [Catenuloplanes nepalensis]MDP9795303.1 transposase [Catenuloplanes nepalensis]
MQVNGVRDARVWARMLGLQKAVVERVEFDEEQNLLVASVRPARGHRRRCGLCGRRSPGYDQGSGRRRWRALDLGTIIAYVEADAPRVSCPEHGIVVAGVPWARHHAGHTLGFDQTVAWLATTCSKSAVTQLMRIAWRTVGAIVARVWADTAQHTDLLNGLTRIGIDEISYRKGHKFLTVIVDHDTGRLVWAAPGADATTLTEFFTQLGPDRCARITHVTSDAAAWIRQAVTTHCPQAIRCADPFHIVAWATKALDEQRRTTWNQIRKAAQGTRPANPNDRPKGAVKTLKNARWALWKNPDTLTEGQREQLDWIAKTQPALYRAWALKEGLRTVFTIARRDPDEAIEALDKWISWARRSRLTPFTTLARSITHHREPIIAAITHRLSNALIESTNTKIRLIIRRGFGFHSPEPIIALAMLHLGGHRPTLPNR